MSPLEELHEAYNCLWALIEAGEHDPACIYRCLVPGCEVDHHCYVCEMWAQADEMWAQADEMWAQADEDAREDIA